jgi:hypothetical protein
MPRAQKKRAARAAAASGVAPAARTSRPAAAGQAATKGPPATAVRGEPPPWTARSLLILAGLVAILQLPLALLDLLRDGHHHGFLVYLVVTLSPVSLLQQVQLFAAYVIAMPVAARLGHEPRPMRIFEALSVAAVVLILLSSLWPLALQLSGGRGVAPNGQVNGGALALGAVADVVALVGGSLAFPHLYRRFWMRRRGMRR